MPFIELGEEFANAKETPLAPEGQYDLKIYALSEDKVPGLKNNLVIDIRFENEGYLQFRHWVALPIPEKDARNDQEKGHDPGTTAKTKMLMAKRFCYLFSIPYTDTGFNTDDFLGSSVRGGVTQRSFTGKDGSEITVNGLILPKLPEEVEEAA